MVGGSCSEQHFDQVANPGIADQLAAFYAQHSGLIKTLQGTPRKSRVTFYYLLGEVTGTIGKLA